MKNIQLASTKEVKSGVQASLEGVKKAWAKPVISEISKFQILGGPTGTKSEASAGSFLAS